jgi:hypothetical protein
MLPIIIGLSGLFFAVYFLIMVIFPMELTTAKDLLNESEYFGYMVLMIIDLYILASIPFFLGVWFAYWSLEQNGNTEILEMVQEDPVGF